MTGPALTLTPAERARIALRRRFVDDVTAFLVTVGHDLAEAHARATEGAAVLFAKPAAAPDGGHWQ